MHLDAVRATSVSVVADPAGGHNHMGGAVIKSQILVVTHVLNMNSEGWESRNYTFSPEKCPHGHMHTILYPAEGAPWTS